MGKTPPTKKAEEPAEPAPKPAEPTPEPAEPAPKRSQSKAGAKGKPKGQSKNGKKKVTVPVDRDDLKLVGPFGLRYRWNPAEKAHCYMVGRFEGETTSKIITNMTAMQHPKFHLMMATIKEEADAGLLPTKRHAVRRRNQIIQAHAEQAAAAEGAQADVAGTYEGGSTVPDADVCDTMEAGLNVD